MGCLPFKTMLLLKWCFMWSRLLYRRCLKAGDLAGAGGPGLASQVVVLGNFVYCQLVDPLQIPSVSTSWREVVRRCATRNRASVVLNCAVVFFAVAVVERPALEDNSSVTARASFDTRVICKTLRHSILPFTHWWSSYMSECPLTQRLWRPR